MSVLGTLHFFLRPNFPKIIKILYGNCLDKVTFIALLLKLKIIHSRLTYRITIGGNEL